MNATDQLTYPQWLGALDALTLTQTGKSLYALPELPYAAAYDRELTPDDFFDTIIVDHLDRQHAATP